MRKADNRLFSDCTIAMVDTETTGLSEVDDRITEVAVTVMDPYGTIVRSCSWLCNPGMAISAEVSELTGITNEMVMDQPTFGQVAAGLLDLIPEDALVAAYNADFDRKMMVAEFCRHGRKAPFFLKPDVDWVDPMIWAAVYDPYARGKGRYKLVNVAERFGVKPTSAHRALVDTETALLVLRELQPFRQNRRKPVFTTEPTVTQFLTRQRIYKAQREVEFLSWLIEQPPLPDEAPDPHVV